MHAINKKKTIAFIVFFTCSLTASAQSPQVTVDVKTDSDAEKVHVDAKSFCSSSSESDAKQQCESWLIEQKKNLGERVLTSNCSQGKYLYGKETDGCLAYLSKGEIKFVLNPKKN